MKCVKCKESFHYCNSCDRETCLENGYCSDKCMEASAEVSTLKATIHELLGSLNYEQRTMLESIIAKVPDFEILIDNEIDSFRSALVEKVSTGEL